MRAEVKMLMPSADNVTNKRINFANAKSLGELEFPDDTSFDDIREMATEIIFDSTLFFIQYYPEDNENNEIITEFL